MKAIVFSPAEEADMGEIWDYSAQRWRVDQADNYIDAIRDNCHALARGTRQGRPVDVLEGCQKGSHMVYFLDDPGRLVVIRILHNGRMLRNIFNPTSRCFVGIDLGCDT